MKERPILFSSPMVRALLAGTKTQTRRIYKPKRPPPYEIVDETHTGKAWPFFADDAGGYHLLASPYGRRGDRLWVRETWRTEERDSDAVDGILFAADGAFVPIENKKEAADRWIEDHNNGKHPGWRPSIFMRRWASRLTLEITHVRFQRLQDISEEDARAEGVIQKFTAWLPREGETAFSTAREAYRCLWDDINGIDGPGCWEANPWIWAISFRRLP